jgi:peroxiredoxin
MFVMKQVVDSLKAIWGSQWVVLAILGVSLSLNVCLVSSRTRETFSRHQLTPGMQMPVLRAEQLKGGTTLIAWERGVDRRPSLLYVFTPTCVWCLRNLPNLVALSNARRSDYHIIGLSLSAAGVAEYVSANHIDFRVYINPAISSGGSLPFTGTPETFLISDDGRIEKAWYGAYQGKVKEEIEMALNVHLQGLSTGHGTN